MDRNLYLTSFAPAEIPAYSCPRKCRGTLVLEGEFSSFQTKASQASYSMDWWDPTHVVEAFSCTLKCNLCLELVMVVGAGGVDHADFEERGFGAGRWHRFYIPKYFHPSLKIIEAPELTPSSVQVHIDTASSLLFASPDACANSIRCAAEVILTRLGVPATKKAGGFIPFAERIKLLDADKKDITHFFNAIRWLGNYGSHGEDTLERQHALDAFEIMEHLLYELYSDRKQKINKLVEGIIENKGPHQSGRR